MTRKHKIIGLGEILWDMLPQGKKLGGAPANFAYFCSALGQTGIVASRVGNDPLGEEILKSMTKLNLSKEYLQIDPEYPTGTVGVILDENGQPDYEIHKNVAWDYLDFSKSWENLSGEADIICFGTLAQRSPRSKKTIQSFLKSSRPGTIRFLDLNIRQDFYSTSLISESLEIANMLKLNTDELNLIRDVFDYSDKENDIDLCFRIVKDFKLDLICLTRGEKGSLIANKKEYHEHEGYKVSISDTIGAGDAFSAAVVVQYIKGKSLPEISDLANKLGAWVASKSGPTPELDDEMIKTFK